MINYNYTGENNQLTLRQIEQELVDMDGAEGSPLDSSAPLAPRHDIPCLGAFVLPYIGGNIPFWLV